MIKLKNIEKVYRTSTIETLALNEINLEVGKGEFLSIMGPSGCGKSTLLNIMGLLDEPSKGEITVDNETIRDFSDKKLASFRNQKLGFIFQSYHLINDLPVLDNVELPLLYRSSSANERTQLATEALQKVGLSNRMKHYPTQLSGGQKQRLSIARALIKNPDILILDDSTSAVDVTTEAKIKNGLKKYAKSLTCLLIAQRITSIIDADKIVVMDHGEIVGIGKHEELLRDCSVYQEIYQSQVGKEVAF